jgi:prophage maintenance system killer protein
MVLFLALNGMAFVPDYGDAVITMLTMAAGEMPDDAFVDWVRANAVTKG